MSKEVAQPSPAGVSGVQGRAGGRAGRPRGQGAGVVPRGPTRQEERGVLAAGPPHAAARCSLLPESCRCRSRRARSESVGVSERMWEGHRQHWLRLHFRAEAPPAPWQRPETDVGVRGGTPGKKSLGRPLDLSELPASPGGQQKRWARCGGGQERKEKPRAMGSGHLCHPGGPESQRPGSWWPPA